MKPPISREELKLRMMQCGGISPDDAENAAVMELLDEIDRLRGVQTPPQGKTDELELKIANMRGDRWSDLAGVYLKERDEANRKLFMIATGLDDLRIKYLLQGNVHFDGKALASELDGILKSATLPVPQEVEVVAEVEDATR